MYVCVCVCVIINIKVYHKTFPLFKTNYLWFQTLVSIKRKKRKHNIKNRKLNCSLYTKKKNNTNKFMQISYHSALKKIKKLQNLKKKKNFFLYRPARPVLVNIARNQLVFKRVRNVDVSISVYIPVHIGQYGRYRYDVHYLDINLIFKTKKLTI